MMTQERLDALLFVLIEKEFMSHINVKSVTDDFNNVPIKCRLVS